MQENELPIGAKAKPVLMTTVGGGGRRLDGRERALRDQRDVGDAVLPPWTTIELFEHNGHVGAFDARAGVARAAQATAIKTSFFIAFLV